MTYIQDAYTVSYKGKTIGYYDVFDDGTVSYATAWGCPWDLEEELEAYGLTKEQEHTEPIALFTGIMHQEYRIPGRKRIIYEKGDLRLDRRPKETDERYSVYRRAAHEGEPDYSPLPHDAPHYEGPGTPENMREWASWYAFIKMDDGTYEAELDEAWWWGGGHNEGGTIDREIPEEWFSLPYEEFLNNVVRLSAASHYGFTAEMLMKKKGLREFFGYGKDPEAE